MKIIVDAFGGDNAPLEVLKGCRDAVLQYGCEIVLAGREAEIREIASKEGISLDKMSIIDAPDVISMEDEPTLITKSMKNCSMAVGLQALADGQGDAFITAGSTGAFLVGSTFIVKRIKGIKRPALGAVLPTDNGAYLLMDTGANVECRPQMLLDFGIMGSIYMEKVMNIKNPRVGLVNVGTEETKGGELQLETHALLKNSGLNFTGNVEARDIPLSGCDVAVCDGFTGNVILKLTEGLAKFFVGNIKGMLTKNIFTKLAALILSGGLKDFKKKMDYQEYGGAPLLGIRKPVFKAHGSSKALAFKSAIGVAVNFCKNNVIDEIEEKISKIKEATV